MTATSPTAAAPERFERPRASVDPDRSLGWLRRLRPVVLVQKWHFIGSIVAGLISMAATVSVPIMLGGGIDAVADGDTPTPFVAGLFGLAVVRFVFGFTYRFGLFRSALRIEKDLRNLMYLSLIHI